MTERDERRADSVMHEGGCLCGAIRYRVAGDPLMVSICHCTNCQRSTGSAFSVNCIFPDDALTMAGAPAVYEDKGDSGHPVQRLFCAGCGTPLQSRSKFTEGRYAIVKAGTFDDPSGFVPDTEIFCASAQPWWSGDAPRQCHDQQPGRLD